MSDEVNNYPILRKGITASDPATDFDGESVTVIDLACFPGSSGSPVFIYNNGTYATRINSITLGTRLYFLGILYAGPEMKLDGTIESRDIPTSIQEVPSFKMMINLGYIIKARALAELGAEILKKYHI